MLLLYLISICISISSCLIVIYLAIPKNLRYSFQNGPPYGFIISLNKAFHIRFNPGGDRFQYLAIINVWVAVLVDLFKRNR